MWLAALFAAMPVVSVGGDWHRSQTLVCSDCHTMHNSRGGAPMRYDQAGGAGANEPSDHLLRGANELTVCSYCHGGADVRAPDVVWPVPAAPTALGYVDLGGGFFNHPSGGYHRLDPTTTVMPSGGDAAVVMTCVTCHDPHGNARYRNLRTNPSGVARAAPPSLDVATTVLPDGSNPLQAYDASNMVYVAGMSQFCKDCHVAMSGHHGSDLAVSGTAEWATWNNLSISDRVRVQNPLFRTAPTSPPSPSDDDQVFCLSCHKAHGSANPGALVAPAQATICTQCHA